MTQKLTSLGIWAVIQTNHVRLGIADAPEHLRSDRVWQARHFAHFIRESVFPLVCDQNTELATALLALQKECDSKPEPARQCRQCPGAASVAALAEALGKWIAGQKGGAL